MKAGESLASFASLVLLVSVGLGAMSGCAIRLGPDASVPGEFPCDDVRACPLSESPCRLAHCLEGSCVHVPAPASPLPSGSQVAGDCRELACDGEGNVVVTARADDTPASDSQAVQRGGLRR
ncbi:MAG: hypothetical protein EXR75_06595 [Myxococcales bacterium]|nr:hypothetical protein [Myxococcales bacterium]